MTRNRRSVAFRIPLSSKQHLSVFVWRTQKEYRKVRSGVAKGSCACYMYNPDKDRREGEFGRMHFNGVYFGSGAVAHELQHFMFDWMRTYPKQVNFQAEEKLAQLADDVTRLFWLNYYKESGV